MDENEFDKLIESAGQALDHAMGKRSDLRTTVLARKPAFMSMKDIADLRARLNVSQSVFANYLNISTKTVQGWEQGTGKPSGAALKLLTLVKTHPELVIDTPLDKAA